MRFLLPVLAALALAACNQNTAQQPANPEPVTLPAAPPAITASSFPEGKAIDAAQFTAAANPAVKTSPSGQSPAERALAVNGQAPGVDQSPEARARRVLIKAQVLLDRAHFSPGVIDGQEGENFRQALAAFEKARGMAPDGKLDAQVWQALVQDGRAVMQDYVITGEDARGPYLEKLPPSDDYKAMAALERLSYTSPIEALAEKFHMDEDLLKALNPDADFTTAGTRILVTAPVRSPLPQVVRIEVDKAARELRAFDQGGKLVAIYPATVGSSDMPTPAGEWEVLSVHEDPVWNYDPAKLNFGDRSAGKLTIPAGPNNPVGLIWIDLSKDTYGIHGAPEPAKVGKTASHGCVRLTNWDAQALAAAVRKGVKVVFVEASSATSA